jgi:hypothetical protein
VQLLEYMRGCPQTRLVGKMRRIMHTPPKLKCSYHQNGMPGLHGGPLRGGARKSDTMCVEGYAATFNCISGAAQERMQTPPKRCQRRAHG